MTSKDRLEKLVYSPLSNYEIIATFLTWCVGLGISFANVFRASRFYSEDLKDYTITDWFGSFWKKDVTDAEWSAFYTLMLYSLPWFFSHTILSQFIKKYLNNQILIGFNVLFSFIFLIQYLGLKVILYFYLQPFLFFFFAIRSRSSIVIWALSMWIMTTFQWYSPTKEIVKYITNNLDYFQQYYCIVTFAWINLRCVSYSLDSIWNKVPKNSSLMRELLTLLAYCTYLPICIGGPIINYNNFYKGISSEYKPWDLSRVKYFVFQLLRYFFWSIFNNTLLHGFYFSALQFNYDILEKLDLWTFCGVGYSMGIFFYLKYVVFYGMPKAFVSADGIDAPPHPKCVTRIHLYSHMWRHFDHGLYLFMHQYIYGPLLGQSTSIWTKYISSFICFTFIFAWHGVENHILIWSICNFAGVTIEGLARAISKTYFYSTMETKLLSPSGIRRWHAILSSPLYVFSLLSNFYFFMGTTVGNTFVSRVLLSWPLGTPTILFFSYCCAQTSIEIHNWEIQKKILEMKKDKRE